MMGRIEARIKKPLRICSIGPGDDTLTQPGTGPGGETGPGPTMRPLGLNGIALVRLGIRR